MKLIAILTTLLFLPVMSYASEQGVPEHCSIIQGEPDVKLCVFDIENSPACHNLEDYPLGPDQLASSYGAQVAGYNYDPELGGFVLTIVRSLPDGKLGSIALFHKGVPGGGVEPGTEACIVAIGTQMDDPL